VQHALNQTARARTQLADSPLPILAAIYFGTHYERLPTLRAYERYFQRVVYVSPSPEIATALRMSDRAISAPGAVAEGRSGWPPRTHHCRQSNKVTYPCVAAVAAAFGNGTRGTLFFHFDFWVQPWALLQSAPRAPRVSGGAKAASSDSSDVTHDSGVDALLDTVWAAPEGRIMQKASGPTHLLPLTCFETTRHEDYRGRFPAWTWDRDLPNAVAAAADAASSGPQYTESVKRDGETSHLSAVVRVS